MTNSQSTLDAELPATDLQQIDAICDRFEADCLAEGHADLANYLSLAPAGGRAALFHDLLNIDLEFRVQNGERPDACLYHKRFPDMASAIDAAFAFLSNRISATRGDIGSEVGIDSTVTSPGADAAGTGASPWTDFVLAEPAEPTVPGYKILGVLGRGGMGVVFKARQIGLNRIVALKMIKSGGFASEDELLRFQNEAKAVAQFDHPHIVPIYEVGRHHGRHFFSMKLIEGRSLDKLLPEFADDPRASAQVVALVATAIHHAHQRGILHRDLKPANILLDENGDPHVTDFGLAKKIEGDGDLTQSGAPVGTPSYMSPEQASGARGAVSTATDVYGLGTILYALLASKAPFAGTTLVETLDRVRTCSPEPPSQFNKQVPRDLEIICLKCLEKEPNHRYASALALAEDLDRWLDGMPIQARPVGRITKLAMWCKRNKALAALAALLLLALVGGIAGVTWKWREADYERAKTEAVNDLLTQGLLAHASPEVDLQAKNKTVRELLDRTGSLLGGLLEGQPEVEAKIRETIGGAYLSLNEYEQAEKHLRSALRIDTQLNGPRHRDTLRATNLLATLLDQTGRGAEAEPIQRRNLADCGKYLGRNDRVTLDAAERLGVILWHQGKTEEAEALLRKNVDDRSRVLKPEHPDTLRSTYLLSRVLRDRHQYADAEHFAYLYSHSVECSYGGNHPDTIVALTNQGHVCRDQGKLAEAEAFYHQAALTAEHILGPQHHSTVAAMSTHQQVVRDLGQSHAER
jgi:tetratricopeptide (TPR) repeat protein